MDIEEIRAIQIQRKVIPPVMIPTQGNQQIAYFQFSSFHSNCGTGTALYVEIAISNDLIDMVE